MPRPKKSAAISRSHVVAFRLNDAEMARLRSEADAAGMAASDTARRKVTGTRAALRVLAARANAEPPAAFELRQQLVRVGVNLNQIARRLHMSGEYEPDELKAACRSLDEVLQKLLSGRIFS